MQKNNHFKILFYVISFCFSFFLFVSGTSAATLYLSPSSKSIDVGKTISISVFVNAGGVAINSAEASITFPKDILEVVSVSKSGSIFSMWVEEPSFSNSNGSISFGGGLPNPGFSGASGKVISIVFKAKSKGSASITLSSASVRANDGLGTDVLSGIGGSKLTLGEAPKEEKPKKEETEVVSKTLTPQAPSISSITHPSSDKWYSNNNIQMSWTLLRDTTSCRILVSEKSDESPSVVYTPAIGKKELKDFDNGIWYFHAQLENANGWGKIAHFKFQIDKENPEYFNIKRVEEADSKTAVSKLFFDAYDKVSGIDHYEVSIDNKESMLWQDDGTHIFVIPALDYGKHLLTAKAFDKAENYITSLFEFETETISAPQFTEYPKELEVGSMLIIKGLTYPNSKITIWTSKNGKEKNSYIVESDADGNFMYKSENGLEKGVYSIYAQVQNLEGLKSGDSSKISIRVRQAQAIRNLYSMIIGLAIMVIALVLVVLFILIRMSQLRKLLSKYESRKNRVIVSKKSVDLKTINKKNIKL